MNSFSHSAKDSKTLECEYKKNKGEKKSNRLQRHCFEDFQEASGSTRDEARSCRCVQWNRDGRPLHMHFLFRAFNPACAAKLLCQLTTTRRRVARERCIVRPDTDISMPENSVPTSRGLPNSMPSPRGSPNSTPIYSMLATQTDAGVTRCRI